MMLYVAHSLQFLLNFIDMRQSKCSSYAQDDQRHESLKVLLMSWSACNISDWDSEGRKCKFVTLAFLYKERYRRPRERIDWLGKNWMHEACTEFGLSAFYIASTVATIKSDRPLLTFYHRFVAVQTGRTDINVECLYLAWFSIAYQPRIGGLFVIPPFIPLHDRRAMLWPRQART